MNGAIIQEHACPRCGIKRTVRYNAVSFCFNCRLTWGGRSQSHLPVPEAELLNAFNAVEIARLVIYRAAVRAGFFNDETCP